MTDGVFDNKQETNQQQETPATSEDVFADQLSSILNDDGQPKYKDVETALDALKESQEFIKKLQKENKEATDKLQEREEELTKMGSIDDFVKRLAPDTKPTTEQTTSEKVDSLSEEKVLDLLNRKLTEREETVVASNNLNTVVSKLSEKHGDADKASAYVKQRAQELNTTPQALKELAMTNPSMALELLGGEGKKPDTPASSLNSFSSKPEDNQSNEAPKFEKGVSRGGLTNTELVDRWKKVQDYTYKQLGVES